MFVTELEITSVRQSAFGLLDSHTGWAGWEAVAHGAADAVTIPDAHLLFSGDFKRAGTDLILSDETQKFVVHDYFRGEHHPTLLSPDGARLAADVVDALTGHGAYAQAAATPNAVVAVGRVAKVEGSATIMRNGVAITVNAGDAVLKGDVLQTGAGVLGVTFADGSTLSLTANSRLMVDDFVYDSNGSANSEVFNLVQGSLSFISGEVAHTGGNMKITTPVATMGIRGTVGGITQASDGTVSFFVVESATGAVITDGAGHVIAQVVQNGPLIQVRATGPLEVVAAEIDKSPQELAVELAILQQIVNTQAVGQQLIQHFQDLQNNQGPHSTGTDHTQIQIDIPKSAFTDAGTGAPPTTQSASNIATVTTTTTDQSGTTTTTHDHVQFQPDPAPPDNSPKPFYYTGGGDPDPANPGDPGNWDPNVRPTSNDDLVIGRDQHNSPVANQNVSYTDPLAAHSLSMFDGAHLSADDVTVTGSISVFGDGSRSTEIAGDFEIHDLGGNLFLRATTSDAVIRSTDDLHIRNITGDLTVEAAAGECTSALAAILACGDITIGNVGGVLLSAAAAGYGSDAVAKIEAASVSFGDVAHAFILTGSPDECSSAFAGIIATDGGLSIGNIGVGDGGIGFLNQGLLAADNGVLSIGTVGGTFVNDGVMRAYELEIAANPDGALANHGKIIVSGGSGGDDDNAGAVGVDLHNSGLFKVTDGAGLQFNGSVHNYDCGTIVASDCGGFAFNDSVFNAGLIKASHGGEIDFDAGAHNFGTIEATSYGSIHFGDGLVDNCGIIEANAGGTIGFSHWVGGNGTLAMDGGTVKLASGTCNAIDFSGTCGGNLVLDCATAGVGQIQGFGPDDGIDLAHLTGVSIVGYTADSCNTGTLELNSCATGNFYLSFTGDGTNYTVDNFMLSCDGNCGTQITEAPAIDVLNQSIYTDSNDVTTVSGFLVGEPFIGNDPLTITASASHGTLSLIDDANLTQNCAPDGTISETGTLTDINNAFTTDPNNPQAHGIVYTPDNSGSEYDSVALAVTDDTHGGTETLNLMFKVSGQGGATLTATCANDVMYGTESCDTFIFNAATEHGNDVVDNFDSSHDVLQFDSAIFNTICDVLASAQDDIDGNAVITTAHDGTITLDHVSAAALNCSNIAIQGNIVAG